MSGFHLFILFLKDFVFLKWVLFLNQKQFKINERETLKKRIV